MYFEYKTTQYTYEKETGYYFPDVNFCNQNGISASNLRQAIMKNQELKLDSMTNELLQNNSLAEKAATVSKSSVFFHTLEGNKAYEIGQKFEDLVMDCTYDGQACEKDDFELFQYDRLFNCYTFVKGWKEKTIAQSVFSGLSPTL